MFRELAIAACKDIESNALAYVLSAMMNFSPTPSLVSTLSLLGVSNRVSRFLSSSDPGEFEWLQIDLFCDLSVDLTGLSQNAFRMLAWIKAAG